MNKIHSSQDLKLSVLQNHLDKFVPISLVRLKEGKGFKRVYECNRAKCRSKFRTLELMEKHLKLKHNISCHKGHYSLVYVNEDYINKRICQCHTKKIVFNDGLDNREFLSNSCFIRICPICEENRKSRNSKHYRNIIKSFKRVSLLTLTFKGYHALDVDVKHRFEYAVKKFLQMLKYYYRKTPYKLKYIRVLEVKYKYGENYYYHFHFLMNLPYTRKSRLVKMWSKANSGESFVVDIQNIGYQGSGREWSSSQKLGYITKYLAKPFENITPMEYALHMYRSRFVETRVGTRLDSYSIIEEKMGLISKVSGLPMYYEGTLTNKQYVKDYG